MRPIKCVQNAPNSCFISTATLLTFFQILNLVLSICATAQRPSVYDLHSNYTKAQLTAASSSTSSVTMVHTPVFFATKNGSESGDGDNEGTDP